MVHKPLADGFFLVGSHVAGPAGGSAGVENDGGAALVVEAGVHMLHPAPVGGGFTWEPGPGREAVQFVGVVIGLGVPVLVPHGIGHDAIEGAEFAAPVPEFGVLEGVADLDLALHVVDDHVHVGHGPGIGDVFLAVELERCRLFRLGPVFHGDFELYEEAPGTTAGIVDGHAGLGLKHAGHDGSDFGRSVELAGALAATLGELANQILVALADDIGLDVVKPQTLGADRFDQIGKRIVIQVALAVGGGIEIHPVDNALQGRVLPGDGPHVSSDLFPNPVGDLADDGPDGLLRIVRHEGEVEADQLVVGLDKLESLLARAHLLGDSVQFIIEHVAETLGEDEGKDVVFVFRRVLGSANGAGRVPDP